MNSVTGTQPVFYSHVLTWRQFECVFVQYSTSSDQPMDKSLFYATVIGMLPVYRTRRDRRLRWPGWDPTLHLCFGCTSLRLFMQRHHSPEAGNAGHKPMPIHVITGCFVTIKTFAPGGIRTSTFCFPGEQRCYAFYHRRYLTASSILDILVVPTRDIGMGPSMISAWNRLSWKPY